MVKKAIVDTFKNRETKIPKSFYNFVKKFDTSILKLSWPDIKQFNESDSFEVYWNILLKNLRNLDLN